MLVNNAGYGLIGTIEEVRLDSARADFETNFFGTMALVQAMLEHAAALGREVFGPELHAVAQKHGWVGEVRGTGVFWALELVRDRGTREPLAPYAGGSPEMGAILAACKRRGLLPLASNNRIHLVPPLTSTREEVREGIRILDTALGEAHGEFM